MKKVIFLISHYWGFILLIILLGIFIAAIFDRNYYIGGDIVLPLNPQNNILKSHYVWEEVNRGLSFFKYTLLFWQIPFYLFSFLQIPPDVGIKIFIIFIHLLGGVFSYLLYRLLFAKTRFDRNDLGIVCGCIFVLSASTFNVLAGTIFLAALPICSYLLVKFLDTKNFFNALLFSFFISLAYLAHLPQVKYLSIFLLHGSVILLLYIQLRNATYTEIFKRLGTLGLITFLTNAVILLPFLYESFRSGGTYSYYSDNFVSYDGNADLHSAALMFITRLFHANLINAVSLEGKFLASRLFTGWSFCLLLFSLLPIFFVRTSKEKRIVYTLLLGFVSFLLIAKGANPPFGEVYRYLLSEVFIFKIFRASAIVAIGSTFFLAALVSICWYYFSRFNKYALFFLLAIHIFVFKPVLLGYNHLSIEDDTMKQKGYPIPNEYFEMGSILDQIPQDSKVLSLPLDETYSYKDWKYIGTSIMYWITKKPFIHAQVAGYPGFKDNLVLQRMNSKEACFWTSINNIGYILKEKDSRIPYALSQFSFPAETIKDNEYFRLEKVSTDCFFPHVYSPESIYAFSGERNHIPKLAQVADASTSAVILVDEETSYFSNKTVVHGSPVEVKDLEEKTFSSISSINLFSEWNYSFTIPERGTYELFIDGKKEETIQMEKGNREIKIPVSKSSLFLEGDENDTPNAYHPSHWEKDSIYLLSISYTTAASTTMQVTLDEKQRFYNGRLTPHDLNSSILTESFIVSSGTHHYQTLIRSDMNALSAVLTVQKPDDVSLDEVLLEKVNPPDVLLVKRDEQKSSQPQLIVKKNNPTKYDITIMNATEPFYLVLSESFSTNWKIYRTDCDGCKKNAFLLPAVAEDKQIQVNGFSNGWYITPEKKDFHIIIEYFPQRLFYLGGIISIATTVGGILWQIRKSYPQN